jgi:hypothetical protein
MAQAELADGGAERMRAVARAVVAHETLDLDAEGGEVSQGAVEEGDGAGVALIGHDLGKSEARSVVDHDVDELPTGSWSMVAAIAGDAMACAHDAAELFDVEMDKLTRELALVAHYIDPGSPWQNGFVESFHGRFRDECLNREQLWTLTEARVVIEDYRHRYNHRRPHRKLGYQSPVRFAQQLTPSPTPVGLRPPCVEDGQTNSNKLNTGNKPSD